MRCSRRDSPGRSVVVPKKVAEFLWLTGASAGLHRYALRVLLSDSVFPVRRGGTYTLLAIQNIGLVSIKSGRRYVTRESELTS